MKITAKILYGMLRDALAAELKAAGFLRLKAGVLGWTRLIGKESLTFWFQCDKWGWDNAFGSRFTLEFQLARSPVAGATGNFNKRFRFAQLLTSEELETVRSMNNSVKSSLEEPKPGHPIFYLGPEGQKAIRQDYELTVQPYRADEDVWLNYFTSEQVAEWAAFFKSRILRMATEFAERVQLAE